MLAPPPGCPHGQRWGHPHCRRLAATAAAAVFCFSVTVVVRAVVRSIVLLHAWHRRMRNAAAAPVANAAGSEGAKPPPPPGSESEDDDGDWETEPWPGTSSVHQAYRWHCDAHNCNSRDEYIDMSMYGSVLMARRQEQPVAVSAHGSPVEGCVVERGPFVAPAAVRVQVVQCNVAARATEAAPASPVLVCDTSGRSLTRHALFFCATVLAVRELIGPDEIVCAVLIGLVARCTVIIFEFIGLSKVNAELMIAASITSTVFILMLVTSSKTSNRPPKRPFGLSYPVEVGNPEEVRFQGEDTACLEDWHTTLLAMPRLDDTCN